MLFIKISTFGVTFLTILSSVITFEVSNCSYDETEHDIKYICDVNNDKFNTLFGDQMMENLYCNNYPLEFIIDEIAMLSFLGCKGNELSNDFLNVHYSNLNILDISHTDIETIRGSDLKNLHRMYMFSASHNRLSHIPVDLFNDTPELFIVDFSFNQIARLDPSVFASAQKLSFLFLSSNLIEELHVPIFSNLRKLVLLDLSNNRIKLIDNDLLESNYALETLDLKDNQVKRLECGFLETLTKMSSLNITFNSLDQINSSCTIGELHIELNIVITPNKYTTELNIFRRSF